MWSTADDVRDLLTGYRRPGVPGVLVLRRAVVAPAWLRGPFDGWERLFDRFGAIGPITVRWTVQGGALIAELAEEYDDEPVAAHRALAKQRKELNGLVAQYARKSGQPHAVIHNDLRQQCGGPTLDKASSEQVGERIELIRRWFVGRR